MTTRTNPIGMHPSASIEGAAPPTNVEFTQTSPTGADADVMDKDGKATAQLTCGADGSSNNFQLVKIEGSTTLIIQEFGKITETSQIRTFDIKNFTNDDAGVYSCRVLRRGGIGFPATDKTLYIGKQLIVFIQCDVLETAYFTSKPILLTQNIDIKSQK